MNSAVETLLKEINELKVMVNTLDADQKYLLRKVEDLRSRVLTLEANNLYGQVGTYAPPIINTY